MGGMEAPIDFSGQVAIVTGAGRGLGRSHALLLASRGASVVVNDIGVERDGKAGDASVAAEVVAEIEAAGGRAVASTDSVATPEGGAAIVQRALDAFGKVDVLIHNAGVTTREPFAEESVEHLMGNLAVHLHAIWFVGQPAWRDMLSRGYGRIVLTTSMAMFGFPGLGTYAAAKLGAVGVMRSLHLEAEQLGVDITVNAIAPFAATRLALPAEKERWGELMDPANVSAVVAYLVSRECRVSGEIVHGGLSHFCRGLLGQTEGWSSGKPGLTPEDVREHLDAAMDPARARFPRTSSESTAWITELVSAASAETLPRQ